MCDAVAVPDHMNAACAPEVRLKSLLASLACLTWDMGDQAVLGCRLRKICLLVQALLDTGQITTRERVYNPADRISIKNLLVQCSLLREFSLGNLLWIHDYAEFLESILE